jgi:TPP-dependent pyruvate/acetoin dehydrogenase alpha subunit
MKRCPLDRFKKVLRKEGVKESEFERLEKDVQRELEEAIRFAEESPFPQPEDALQDLYAEP